ncbi:nucleoside deaminase [Desulfurispira natronophila]|uniref:tRNA-specific adenosine deaminase n=1 Tax=Desulfurispira natronophila TaxID=682562 RepID=A0A7W8DGU4_9BACT|nr:nucleoside deaminase [Desulfurispira natronophila]MBB5021719.1 tRNA(adenine34) deaminase [Desulfurispira natronophila]
MSPYFTQFDHDHMEIALEEAHAAGERGEVPVGAVAVYDKVLIARHGNRREELDDPSAHAEILVLREAAKQMKSWRLTGVHLYVTLEPCIMCCGALMAARIERLYYGCRDDRFGGQSLYHLLTDARLNHQVDARSGLQEAACKKLLDDFFRTRRNSLLNK